MPIAVKEIEKFLSNVKERINRNEKIIRYGRGLRTNLLFDLRSDENCPWSLCISVGIKDGIIEDIRISDKSVSNALVFTLTWGTFLRIAKGHMNVGTTAVLKKKIKIKGGLMTVIRYRKYLGEVIRTIQDVISEYGGRATILLSRAEFLAPHIIIGRNVRSFLSGISAKRALIVTDKTMTKIGFVEEVKTLLEKNDVKVSVFDEIAPEPPEDIIRKGAKFAARTNPDLIIGLGGGSAMDAAKAILLCYHYPSISLERVDPGMELDIHRKAKLMLIPTTSGTGSEVTWASVISFKREGEKQKLGLGTREFIADIALVDPYFVENLPKKVVATTGLDVLSHAIESLLSPWCNEIVRAVALRAIKLTFRHLVRSYNGDLSSREKMHYAATLAGLAFGNSQATLAHGLGHAFGATFRIPHGFAVALFLPYVLRYYKDTAMAKEMVMEVSEELRVGRSMNSVVSAITSLINKVGGKTTITGFGISRKDFLSKLDWLVKLSKEDPCTYSGPKLPSDEDIRTLYLSALGE